MDDKITIDHEALKNDIHASLTNAERNAIRIRKMSTWLLIISILTSAATTLVSAVTAARGPIIGEGPSGWKISCVIAATFGFATTVCVGANQGFRFSDRGSRANECAGKLKSLDISIKTGNKNWEMITREYEDIVSKYPEEVRVTSIT
jgi:hypothetical protein